MPLFSLTWDVEKVVCVGERLGRLECESGCKVEDGTAKKLGKPLEPKLRDAGGCVRLAYLSLRRPLSRNGPLKMLR